MIPDLSDRTAFPSFDNLPDDHDDSATPVVLLAEVKNDMTITKPTLVLVDRDNHSFALIFEGLARDGLDLAGLGFRPGATVVVPDARKTTPPPTPPLPGQEDDPQADSRPKRPIVRIPAGAAHTVQAVPTSLERVVATAARLRQRQQQQQQQQQGDQEDRTCASCAATGRGSKLLRCAGCRQTWYCDRTCQTGGWAAGHKTECKALRDVWSLWGS